MSLITIDQLESINSLLEKLSTPEIIEWAMNSFDPNRIKLSTNFGAEGIVVIDHIFPERSPESNTAQYSSSVPGDQSEDKVTRSLPKVFTIDTGRSFQETYDLWEKITSKYQIEIQSFGPTPEDLADLYADGGPNLFYQSAEKRQRCCHVRKVKPLARALKDTDLWITGIRREQTSVRADHQILSHRADYGLFKLCPILKWSEEEVWEYIRAKELDYNQLYAQGYQTIGCVPCTRPVLPGGDPRSGRWWWEEDSKKECGIHIEDGVVTRKAPPEWSI